MERGVAGSADTNVMSRTLEHAKFKQEKEDYDDEVDDVDSNCSVIVETKQT